MTESIHTLQEFMTQSKGVIYVLAIGFLVSFTWFWRFLHAREKRDE